MKASFFGMFEPMQFATLYFFAVFGAILSWLQQVQVRDKLSKSTPYSFSLRFFIIDNYARIITSGMLIYLGIRFCTEIFGWEVNEWKCVCMGLGLDKVSQYLKDRTNAFGKKKDNGSGDNN